MGNGGIFVCRCGYIVWSHKGRVQGSEDSGKMEDTIGTRARRCSLQNDNCFNSNKMKQPILDSKYIDGQRVYAKINPSKKLIIRRYYDRIYYCRDVDGSEKEYAFFERELSTDSDAGRLI